MPRYFLHLRDGGDELLDPEGSDFPDRASLTTAVLRCARDVMAADVLQGELKLGYRIEAEDRAGRVVYTLHFRHAIEVRG